MSGHCQTIGVDGGVFEIAPRRQGNAFRVLYAMKIGAEICRIMGSGLAMTQLQL